MTFAGAASAAVIVDTFTLDTSGISGLADQNFGTVTVVDNGINLYISVALAANEEFRYAPDSNHHTLTFDLDKNNAVLTSLATNVSTTQIMRTPGTAFSESPFGNTWNYAVDCKQATGAGTKAKNGCLPGYTKPVPTGTLAAPGAGLNPSEIALKAIGMHISDLKSVKYTPASGHQKNIWFAVDIVTSTGKTGNVGASSFTETSYAPEPATWALVILGFGCVGADFRRRRRLALTA